SPPSLSRENDRNTNGAPVEFDREAAHDRGQGLYPLVAGKAREIGPAARCAFAAGCGAPGRRATTRPCADHNARPQGRRETKPPRDETFDGTILRHCDFVMFAMDRGGGR